MICEYRLLKEKLHVPPVEQRLFPPGVDGKLEVQVIDESDHCCSHQ